MPLFWLSVSPPPAPTATQTKQPQISDYGDEVQVTGKVRTIDVVRKIDTYEEGIRATFGPTVITADRLEVHYADGEKFAVARGNVHLDDPEGTVDANYVLFWFGPKKGPDGQMAVADGVKFKIENVTASAEYATMKPERWEFYNVAVTNCQRPLPLYLLRSKKIVLVPGKQGTAYHPQISVLGKELPALPTRRFSLDRRNPGLQIPAISYRRDGGIGIDWTSGFLLNDQTLLQADVSSFQRQLPSYSLTYSHSFIPADAAATKIAAKSELSERFAWSYFDDIRVPALESSANFTTKKRNSVTAMTTWNAGSTARLESEKFSKAIDVAYERGGTYQGLGTYLQVRGQSIRRGSESFIERSLVTGTLQLPQWEISHGLKADVRFDLQGLVGGAGAFGWARSQIGVIYRPIPQLSLGAAYISATEGGHPDFVLDRLVSKNAMHWRADLNLGPTQISYLAKYDFNRQNWYDKEFSISQAVGCLEPFLIRREFPRDYVLGVRLRLGNFFELLERRKQTRTKPTGERTPIEGPPKKQP